VFVHGGWADSSGWNAEIANLSRLGYPVIAPANPLRGLSSDAANIHSVFATIPGDVVLVGHSFGGAVITTLAAG
jgi:pimeloyl-ACP methyl ester carboxylesterase